MAVEEVGLALRLKNRRETSKGLTDTKGELGDVADAGEKVARSGDRAARGLEKASSSRWARGFAAIGRGAKSVAGFVGRGLLKATKVGVVGLAALSVGLAGVSVKAIGLAGDANETASAFSTVFGPAARGVQKDLDRLTKRFGLYNPELQDAARQFGVFAKAAKIPRKDLAGFSTDLTQAGLDLSSFYNVDPGEAFQALQSGLSGEAEPLRRFGIFLSDATMKAEAATMGLTGTLTEQQKVMVRQRIIMKSLGDAQGDLARTAGGFANQQRAASGRSKQLLTMLGGPLTTAATGAFRGINAVLAKATKMLKRELPGLNKDGRQLSRTFERWGRSAAKDLPHLLDRIRGGASKLRGTWTKLTKSFEKGDTGGKLKGIKDDLVALKPAFDQLVNSGINDTLKVTGIVTGFLADHAETLAKYMPLLVTAFVAMKVAQAAGNIALAASIPLRVMEAAITWQHTAALGANTAALTAQAGATQGATAANRGLTMSILASPIFWIVAGIMLLVGAFILAYKKVDWFRNAVDWLWNKVLKPLGSFLMGTLSGALEAVGGIFTWLYDNAIKPVAGFIKTVLITYLKTLAKMWLMMARFGLKAFTWLLKAAFATFDGILSAAEKGLGWIKGIGGKIKGAREAFNDFGNKTIGKLDQLGDKLKKTQDAVDGLAKDRSATITITTRRVGSEKTTGGFGPQARATGGPVVAGRPYIVGEHRPELFVPGSSGVILPRVPDRADLGDLDAAYGAHGHTGPLVIVHTKILAPDGEVLAEMTDDAWDDAEARL